jgi:phospholipid-transporting ATPase
MRNGAFVETMWKDVRVGDIIKILRNRPVPADCVFLSSFSSDLNNPDTCYVQTAQLDGETNLKLRQAIPATVAAFQSDADCASFMGCVRCEPPTSAFEKFVGQISMSPQRMDSASGGSRDLPLPLEAAQTLLRGSIIRNVDYVFALVVYTGRETKVRVRQQTSVPKRAQVEKQMNGFIVFLVGMLVLFCLAGGIISSLLRAAYWNSLPYLAFSGPGSVIDGVNITFTYFLLNSSFIPVSLYVSVRLARTCQMLLMERDTDMYHVEPEVYKVRPYVCEKVLLFATFSIPFFASCVCCAVKWWIRGGIPFSCAFDGSKRRIRANHTCIFG